MYSPLPLNFSSKRQLNQNEYEKIIKNNEPLFEKKHKRIKSLNLKQKLYSIYKEYKKRNEKHLTNIHKEPRNIGTDNAEKQVKFKRQEKYKEKYFKNVRI